MATSTRQRNVTKPEKRLTNFRFEPELLEELETARFALGKPSLAALVREALRRYLDEHAADIRAYKRLRKRTARE